MKTFMKRGLFVLVVTSLLQLHPVLAIASDCPETWNIQSPRLTITTEKKDVALAGAPGKSTTFYVPSLTVLHGAANGIIYDTKSDYIRKMRPFIQKNFGKDFLGKLEGSTSQIMFRDGFVPAADASQSDISKVIPIFKSEVLESFTPYNLVRYGNFYSGIELKYLMEITVRGCAAPFLISSNVATLPRTDLEEIGWSRWLKETEIWLKTNYEQKGQTVNWIAWDKNVTLFRRGLDDLKKGSIKIPFGWNQALYSKSDFSPVVGDNYAIPSIHGFSPLNCAVSSQYSQLPTSVVLSNLPCKVIVASTFTGANPSETASSPFIEVIEIPKITVSKKTTITCVKGKQSKKITALSPKCPAGYKSKK